MPLFNQSQLLFGGHVRSVGGTHPLWRIATIYGSVWLRYSRKTPPSACLALASEQNHEVRNFLFSKRAIRLGVVIQQPSRDFPRIFNISHLSASCIQGSLSFGCAPSYQHDSHGLLIVKLVSHVQHWGLSVLNSFHDVRLPLKH
jgi:hypothetical protein